MQSRSSSSLSPEEQFVAERFCVLRSVYTSEEGGALVAGPKKQGPKLFNKAARLAKASAYQEHSAGLLRVHGFHFAEEKAQAFREEYDRLEALAPVMNAKFDPLSIQARQYKEDCWQLYNEVSLEVLHAINDYVLPVVGQAPLPRYEA